MIVAIVLGLFLLGLGGLCVLRLMRTFRETSLVSPILLDEALDPDLRSLCRRLRRRDDLSAAERGRFCRIIVSVAARRAAGEDTEEDRSRVAEASRELRRARATFETDEPNTA